MLISNGYDYSEKSYRVRMMSWDALGGDRTLAVVSSLDEADRLVDKYSEQYPHAFVDYVYYL